MLKKIKENIDKLSYLKIFSLHEVEQSFTLQILFYIISISFFVTFYGWVERSTISISSYLNGSNVCPPYFQGCGKYYFLEGLPYGYTQGFFYVIIFLILLYGLFSAAKHNWKNAHLSLLTLLTWKIIYVFFLTYGTAGNFDYYDMLLAFVWLFLKEKEYFAKLLFVTFYFAASTIKIHEGWILGNYLNTTILGSPFFDNSILPIFTNIVILMQMIGSWFLLSKHTKIQKLAFLYFVTFHLYSGIIVNYRYITISLTTLLVLFSFNFDSIKVTNNKYIAIKKISKKTLAGYIFLGLLLCSQWIAILIPGDQKKTLEGTFYGLFMFDANHQCSSNTIVEYKDGKTKKYQKNNTIANNRCDPYQHWYKIKRLCEIDPSIEKIHWDFDHSINGHHYERIVSVDNACTLNYKNLSRNEWIKIGSDAKTTDQPVYKDGYSRSLNSSKNGPLTAPNTNIYLDLIINTYWTIWFIVLLTVIGLIL